MKSRTRYTFEDALIQMEVQVKVQLRLQSRIALRANVLEKYEKLSEKTVQGVSVRHP